MSYTRTSLAAAEREASDRNVAAERSGAPYRYHAERYPEGTSDVAAWRWGVVRMEQNYHKDGSARLAGFVWREEV